jgi:uncharacterized Zn finger protein
MSLSTKLAGNFTKNVRKRGDDYYRKGRVLIHEGSQSELTACVRGSGFYEVQFTWRDNKLAVWCDCPHFVEQGVPCKHVWATTLAADQHQYLTAAASADKLILDLDLLARFVRRCFLGSKTDTGPNAILAIPPTQVRFPRHRSASHLCDPSSEFRAVAAKPGGKGTRP